MERQTWSNVLSAALARGSFSPNEIARIYQLEMEARTFFEWAGIVPDFLVLHNMEREDTRIRYDWASRSRNAVCPRCDTTSQTPAHEYVDQSWQDLPQDGRAVWHDVRRQKYVCRNLECPQHDFVERLPGFAAEKARKTLRFQRHCVVRALASGCKPAEDALKAEGASVSNDTISRYIKAVAAQQIDTNLIRNDVRVIAVDDIYLRKGDKSSGCTVFLDEETHRVLIIVRGTTKAAVTAVLESFPAATFFSRDRASAYSAAAEQYGKIQVADRFHLIENAHQAVRDALMTLMPATIFLRNGAGWVPADPARRPDRVEPVRVPDDQIEDRIRLAHLTPKQAKKYRHTLKILELGNQGLRSAEIAQTLGIALKELQSLRRSAVDTVATVEAKIHAHIQQANDAQRQRTARAEARHPETLRPRARPSQNSIVEPYRDIVIREIQRGGNHRTIHPLLQQQGFAGSANTVYQYILKLRQEIPEALHPVAVTPPADLQLQQIARNTVYKAVLKRAADTRPTEAKSEPKAAAQPVKSSNKPRPRSPFSVHARALMFGEDPTTESTSSPSQDSTKDKEPDSAKKNQKPNFRRL